MTNATLKARLLNDVAKLERAFNRRESEVPQLMVALSVQVELAANSLERLSQPQRGIANLIAHHLALESSLYADGFDAKVLSHIEALREWLAGVPE